MEKSEGEADRKKTHKGSKKSDGDFDFFCVLSATYLCFDGGRRGSSFIIHHFAGIIEGMGFEVFEIDPFEGGFVSGGEGDGRGAAGIEGFFPASDAEAPAIAGFEAGEIPLGRGGGEIVAAEVGEIEELFGGFNADGVEADVTGAGAAVAIAVEAGHGFAAAAGEWFEKDVGAHVGND